MSETKTIAITGASGFLGKVVLEKLITNGYRITVLDSKGSSYPKGLKIVRGNLLSKSGYEKFADGADILIHLAGQVESGKTTMYQGNVVTTKNLLSKISKNAVKKIIFASSVAVYGGSQRKIFKEEDVCIPDTEYGKSKLKAEKVIEDWSLKTKRNYATLRFFSLYGYTNRKGFIYRFCRSFLNSTSIMITGDGKQERDLVWVDDAAEAILQAVKSDMQGIYNVGTGKNYSLLKIIALLEKIAGKKCDIKFIKNDEEKVKNIHFSSEKIHKVVNWKPKILPEKGLRLLYDHLLKSSFS